jgi:CRP/FNR family transcriptional regulator, cyclic AMP receptor protein
MPLFLRQQLDGLLASLDNPMALLALLSAAAAGLLVVVSAFVKTMIPLRWLAVGSNVGFIAYGLLNHSALMVALHAVLLPVNLWRVVQMVQLTRRVSASNLGREQLQVWLRPYMRSQRLKAGTLLFAKGDEAHRLYLLGDGQMEMPELGRSLHAGEMFGEIAFFAPDRLRSASARCVTDCWVLSIDEATFKQLYFQNPDFGLQIVRLIAGRLSEDVQRLRSGQTGPAQAE